MSQGKSILFCLFFKGSGGDDSMGHNTEEEAKLLSKYSKSLLRLYLNFF